MIANNVPPEFADPAGNSQLHKLYTSSQEMRLKAEAELQYTKRRLQTLSFMSSPAKKSLPSASNSTICDKPPPDYAPPSPKTQLLISSLVELISFL